MRHRRGKNCLILIPHDGCRQVVVVLWPLDMLKTHADGD